ncbi:MAG: helix-turn-helix domain-containing protein [candidate division WOR-3 bacterium]
MGIPKPESERFLSLINKLGYPTMASLAEKMGISRQRLSQVVINKRDAIFLRRRIAQTLGLSYEETWGEPDPLEKLRTHTRSIIHGTREDTKRFLRIAHKAGYPTVKAVADAVGIEPHKLFKLIYKETGHTELRQKIASLLGVKYEQLWHRGGEKSQSINSPKDQTQTADRQSPSQRGPQLAP